jgi:Protein of unknown function (DUF2865)
MRLCRIAKSANFARTLVFSAAVVMTMDAAVAASCSSLKSELSRLQSSSGKQSPAAQKWTKAKGQQQKAISAAQRDAGFFGCGNASNAKCQALNKKIKRMKANLAAIERQLAKSGGNKSTRNSKRIRQVKAAIANQNCNSTAKTRDARNNKNSSSDKPKSLLSRLFNPKQKVELAAAKTGDREIATVRSRHNRSSARLRIPSRGNFRTLCVRTCDGYFFPLSYSIKKNQLAYDVARCSEICPAAETELYVYRNPGGDQSKMMSLAGNLYSEQPFAYRYKTEYVEGCSCRQTQQSKKPSLWTEVNTGSGKRIFLSDISAGIPRRTLQPSRGGTFDDSNKAQSLLSRTPLNRAQLPLHEDPDTLFNLEMGFDVTATLSRETIERYRSGDPLTASKGSDGLPLLASRASDGSEVAATSPVFKSDDPGFRPAPDRDAPVRVVGPEFFVAQ